jgi:N-acetylmuramoyl-L-alanine amidase
MKMVISSGHGLHVRGASALIDEVDEARRVVSKVVGHLNRLGHSAVEFHDDTSKTQDENLKTIVNFHNSQERNLDVSVHFNCYLPTEGGRGTEVLYLTQEQLAAKVSTAISESGGLINRGAHKRTDLYFLNKTDEPAILIEVCFVDAEADVDAYEENFDLICQAIAMVAGPVSPQVMHAKGRVSWFGGPDDTGVSPDEGLAFLYSVEDKPHLFLPEQPENTTGLARRLDPDEDYIAMRWDYDVFSKDFLRSNVLARVRAVKSGRSELAHPADWGPHVDTSRVADISPGLMKRLGIETDDEVEIVFPVNSGELP